MPNQPYSGNTFVAFIDISGFKNMMRTKERAGNALHHFYSIGYYALNDQQKINGVFISDCGILYHSDRNTDPAVKLLEMLDVIKRINREMAEQDYLLTTSIAYGDFSYHEKVELSNMTKSAFVGSAYLDAYLDNEYGIPKLQAGECRVVIHTDFEDDINQIIEAQPLLKRHKKHLYYHWMIPDDQTIVDYENRRKTIESNYTQDTKNLTDQKFAKITQLIKGHDYENN